MGTSKSGTGPGAGVPLTPPWVSDPPSVDYPSDDSGSADPAFSAPDTTTQVNPPTETNQQMIAPRGRFGPARKSLGGFGQTGSRDDLRRGIGHYVRKGYGGAKSAAQRMGGTARTAGTLYGALSSAAAGQPATPGSPFDPTLLSGRTAEEVMDALIEAVRPIDGTQDAEAGRDAIRNSLAELLERFPDANLLDLTEDQRLFAIEMYVSIDVFNRVILDIGKAIQDNAPTASVALSRLKEVKDYVRETVSSRFRDLQQRVEKPTTRKISSVVQRSITEAFDVFEDYVS